MVRTMQVLRGVMCNDVKWWKDDTKRRFPDTSKTDLTNVIEGKDKDNHKNLPKIVNKRATWGEGVNLVQNQCFTDTTADFFAQGSVTNHKYPMMKCEFYGKASTPLPCRLTFDNRVSYVSENREEARLNYEIKDLMLQEHMGADFTISDNYRAEIEYIWGRYYDPNGPHDVPPPPEPNEEDSDIIESDETSNSAEDLVEVRARNKRPIRRAPRRLHP